MLVILLLICSLNVVASTIPDVALAQETTNGSLMESIDDGNRQIYVLSWYELSTVNQTKKVQVAIYCKNLSDSPGVCLRAASLTVMDRAGSEYPPALDTYFPALRIPTQDVIAAYPRFDVPQTAEITTLFVGGDNQRIGIDLKNTASPQDSIPISNWEPKLPRGTASDPEKMMRVLDLASQNNLIMVKLEFTNVGFMKTSFNSQFMYLKDELNTVHRRTSVPSADYSPELSTNSLERGQQIQGWVAFTVGEVGSQPDNYMLVYDDPNGSFLNTGSFIDNIDPEITVPPPMFVKAGSSRLGTIVTFNATAHDDHSTPVILSCEPESGALFSVGPTEVECRARDAAGNTALARFTITVERSASIPVENILQIDGNDYIITSVAENARIKALSVNSTGNFIKADIDSSNEEQVTLSFPKTLIDGITLVSIDGEKIQFERTEENELLTSIKFTLPESARSVEVYGAQVIPEFGLSGIALMVGFSLVMVYILGKMTLLNRACNT